MQPRRYSWFVGFGAVCLALQAQSCGGSDSTTEEEPTYDASFGGSGAKDSSAEGGTSGSKAGSGGAKGGSAGAQAGGGGSKAGSGGADAGAGKGGSAGADAGKGGADASAGSAGSKDGGAGVDGSPSDTGSSDALGDANEEADAAAVCTLQTGDAVCQACMLTSCNDPCLTCEQNPFCVAIISCVQVCTDDNCKKQCWDNNKDGQDDFNAFASQSGCLQSNCATECPGLPNTGGCSVASNRPGDPGWLLLAAMLGLARVMTRKKDSRSSTL